MFRILLATDGSIYALNAADYAAALAKKIANAEITLIHVVDTSYIATVAAAGLGMTVSPTAIFPEELEKVAEKSIQATTERLSAAGVQSKSRIEHGRPAEVICSIAEKEKFDLIAVGSSGMGHITGIFLGSVSDKVIHRARVPVLVIRGAGDDQG